MKKIMILLFISFAPCISLATGDRKPTYFFISGSEEKCAELQKITPNITLYRLDIDLPEVEINSLQTKLKDAYKNMNEHILARHKKGFATKEEKENFIQTAELMLTALRYNSARIMVGDANLHLIGINESEYLTTSSLLPIPVKE
jgi:hypothetical protein